MIPTNTRSVLNWSACAVLIGDVGMVDVLSEVRMSENELRDRVQQMSEASKAHRELDLALRQAAARRALNLTEATEEGAAVLAESQDMLDALARKLCYWTGRTDVTTAHVVAAAAERFLYYYDVRLLESEQQLSERFCEFEADQATTATRDLHELLDAAVEAREDALKPLEHLLRRTVLAPIVVESGKQLNLVH